MTKLPKYVVTCTKCIYDAYDGYFKQNAILCAVLNNFIICVYTIFSKF